MSENEVKNKNEEKRLAKLFFSLNFDIFKNEFRLDEYERPDFLVRYDNKIIGLELTRLPNTFNSEQLIYTSFINDFCLKLTDKINSKGYYIKGSLLLKNSISKLGKKKGTKLLEYLFDLIKTDYDSLDYKQEYVPKGDLELMYPIITFIFSKVRTKNDSQITPADAVVLPFLTSEIVQDVIDKKNALLKGYKKVDENWLLIHFGSDFSDEFDQAWKNTLFEVTSRFNRVYLLDERLNGFSKLVFNK